MRVVRAEGNFINHYVDVRKRIAATQMCEHACASGKGGGDTRGPIPYLL